jgi:transketolase
MSQTVVQAASLRESFGQILCELADPEKPNFFVAGVDLAGGVGSHRFRTQYPDRHIELGIAEQAAMGISAGLAASTGLPIFLPGFSTFLMRGWEPARLAIFHDKRNVRIVAGHLGVSAGPDGASVQELSYIATWRSLPNAVVLWPVDAVELRQVLEWSLKYNGPMIIFTGRNPVPEITPPGYQFKPGIAQQVYPWPGSTPPSYQPDVALISCGHTVAPCVQAAEILGNGYGIEARVVNLSSLKPVNDKILRRLCEARLVVTVEDHSDGGLYGIVTEALAPYGFSFPIISIKVEGFGESGEPGELAEKYGLDGPGIARKVLEALG